MTINIIIELLTENVLLSMCYSKLSELKLHTKLDSNIHQQYSKQTCGNM